MTTDATPDMLPCPWCGMRPSLRLSPAGPGWMVNCETDTADDDPSVTCVCPMFISTILFPTPEEAVRAWNDRKYPPPPPPPPVEPTRDQMLGTVERYACRLAGSGDLQKFHKVFNERPLGFKLSELSEVELKQVYERVVAEETVK